MTNPDVAEGLRQLFVRRSDFVVLGLTGRTGSGCTTAAQLLTRELSDLKLPEPKTADAGPEDRKHRIVRDFVERNWKPFLTISVSNVILSFLLDEGEAELRTFLSQSTLLGQTPQLEGFIKSWQPAQEAWLRSRSALKDRTSTARQQEEFVANWRGVIYQFFTTIRSGLGPNATKILQIVGDNLRKSGKPFSDAHDPQRFYELPERVADLIATLR